MGGGGPGGGGSGSGWRGGQGGCERKIEVFVKIQKKNWGGGGGGVGGVGGGVRVDVNEVFGKIQKKKIIWGGGSGGVGSGGPIFEPKTLSMYLKKEKEK